MRKEMDMTIQDLIAVLKQLASDIKADDKTLSRLLSYTAERLEAFIS